MSILSLKHLREKTIFFVALFAFIGLASLQGLFKVGATDQSRVVSHKFKKDLGDLDITQLGKSKKSCCGAAAKENNSPAFYSPEYETYKLTATYYSLRENLHTTLMLNNKGPEPILAVPTFYSLSGTRLNPAPITVPAASYIEVDMRECWRERRTNSEKAAWILLTKAAICS